MTRAVVLAVIALALLGALSAPASAQIYTCRRYPPRDTLADLKARVEAVRLIEREADDRLRGLDTRPYTFLLDQMRFMGAAIADPFLLEAEEELKRCRNAIIPVRRVCADAAAALVRVVLELSVGEATREARAAYAQAMRQCERWTGLSPLQTALRASN